MAIVSSELACTKDVMETYCARVPPLCRLRTNVVLRLQQHWLDRTPLVRLSVGRRAVIAVVMYTSVFELIYYQSLKQTLAECLQCLCPLVEFTLTKRIFTLTAR